ncbi:uncharacterized protein LOC134276096 [Saccostrea cucullata]|uniref:uncharacterized protein LOC134276096 n=1 Tax=Saccostrea cuccullata TaxID=36930 RepID=UPI002ED12CB3
MMQAEVLSAVVYQIVKTINCGQRYITDLKYVTNESLCVSVVNTKDIRSSNKFGNGSFRCLSTQASYLCYMRCGYEYFIFWEHGYLKCLRTRPNGSSQEPEPFENWNNYANPWKGYEPNGIAACKSGGILVCLWNKQVLGHSQVLYITENGNEDICVSDVNAVVVTDAGGLLRFRYKGLSDDSQFDPYGICSDSQNNIIIADMKKNRIHLIDQNGEFLHYIQYKDMNMPRALCIDEDNNLYVGEWTSEKIKVLSRQ